MPNFDQSQIGLQSQARANFHTAGKVVKIDIRRAINCSIQIHFTLTARVVLGPDQSLIHAILARQFEPTFVFNCLVPIGCSRTDTG